MTNDTERWIRTEILVDHAGATCDHLWSLGALGIEIQDKETFMEDGSIPPVPEGKSRLIAFFDDKMTPEVLKETILRAIQTTDADDVHVTYFDDESWKTAWQAYFKPVRLSKRCIVGPPWEDFEAPTEWVTENGVEPVNDGVKLVINPGLAFGTGTHETTQLLAMLIDDILSTEPCSVDRLLDVGCGSGILSILAHRLGVASVVGIDIDADAIESANENIADSERDSIQLTTTALADIGTQYPVVLANILAHIILSIRDELAKVTMSGGRLLTSGVLVADADEFAKTMETAGFSETYRTSKGEWAAFIFERTGELAP